MTYQAARAGPVVENLVASGSSARADSEFGLFPKTHSFGLRLSRVPGTLPCYKAPGR
jgi:hypothetical protein